MVSARPITCSAPSTGSSGESRSWALTSITGRTTRGRPSPGRVTGGPLRSSGRGAVRQAYGLVGPLALLLVVGGPWLIHRVREPIDRSDPRRRRWCPSARSRSAERRQSAPALRRKADISRCGQVMRSRPGVHQRRANAKDL
jgi:hypothetical protein